MRQCGFGEQGMEPVVVVRAKENRLAVVTALNDVQRLIGQKVSTEPCHRGASQRARKICCGGTMSAEWLPNT
jgi:hypothetical protein